MKLIYGKYYCTEDGKVINYKTGKELKPQNSDGYYRVWISYNGTKKQMRVHRLVWEYYNGVIPKGMQINHINGVGTDNRLVNLELCTQSENIKHADKIGLRKNHRSKPYKVQNLDTGEIFNSLESASLANGLHKSSLNSMFRRGYKTCGGYTWKKLEE